MATPNPQFYVVGGTVNPDSPSYVVRKADQELYDRLLAGEFCYVLTSRQMGKSSLMARTARRLTTEAKIHAAIVDLTQIGTERDKLSSEQWYYGIAHRILRELKLRDVNLSEWWQSRAQLPALQRLTEFFRDLLLEQIEGQIVIFIDEIDSTISLPFTDDFFAAIRACHNARATDAAYNRLSFVLLGVASPSDLVKDATRTPFNVGQRIELTDFTAEEAKPLAAGLSANLAEGEQILARILDWTGGHPYLTQKLCGAMQSPSSEAETRANVDSLVEQHFFSQTAGRDDFNLKLVVDTLTNDSNVTTSFVLGVLTLYLRICLEEKVFDDPISLIHTKLKLSGIVRAKPDGALVMRNRIYGSVFTPIWVKQEIRKNLDRMRNEFDQELGVLEKKHVEYGESINKLTGIIRKQSSVIGIFCFGLVLSLTTSILSGQLVRLFSLVLSAVNLLMLVSAVRDFFESKKLQGLSWQEFTMAKARIDEIREIIQSLKIE